MSHPVPHTVDLNISGFGRWVGYSNTSYRETNTQTRDRLEVSR